MANVDKNKQIPKYSQNISDLAKTADESVRYALTALEQRLKAARIVPKGFIFSLVILLCASLLPSCKVMERAHSPLRGADYSYAYEVTQEELDAMKADRDFERGTKKPLVGSSTTNKVKKGGRN